MDPFARKMIFGALAFGLAILLMTGATSMIYYHYRPLCSESEFSQSTSPDGQWAADVMARRCGDESPYMIHVNLRHVGEPIRFGYLSGRADAGEVFLTEQESPEIVPTLEWSAPSQLTIRCSGCRAAGVHEEHWGPITVRYQLSP